MRRILYSDLFVYGLPSLASLLFFAGSIAAQPEVPPMKEWEADVRKRIMKDEHLKKLNAKYPFVLLHSRSRYCEGDYKQSAYSFLYHTSDEKKHGNNVQLTFSSGNKGGQFYLSNNGDLLVDLGDVDFEKNPDPKKISITHPGFKPLDDVAVEGHVYLERVRDAAGSNFYVVFKVIAVDHASRYVAFFWRMLPGGKLVFPKDQKVGRRPFDDQPHTLVSLEDDEPVPTMKEWEQTVRKTLSKTARSKSLAAKYPLVLVHSHNIYDQRKYQHSGFSFICEKHCNVTMQQGDDLSFNGGIRVNNCGGQHNFVVDLGKQDFEKEIDPAQISIDHPGLTIDTATAVVGHIYLERIRDYRGSDFYVVFQVVAVDPKNRYMAFLWRRLPGGKILK